MRDIWMKMILFIFTKELDNLTNELGNAYFLDKTVLFI